VLVLPAVLESADGTAFADDARPGRYYVVPAVPRIRRREDGQALLTFVKYRTAPTGSDEASGGGFLELQTELALTDDQRATMLAALAAHARSIGLGGPPDIVEPTYLGGTVALVTFQPAAGGMVEHIAGSTAPSLGPGLTASFSLKLSRDGAALLWDQMQATPSPVSIRYELDLIARFPLATVHAFVRSGPLRDQWSQLGALPPGPERQAALSEAGVAGVDVMDWPTGDETFDALRQRLLDLVWDVLDDRTADALSAPAGSPVTSLRQTDDVDLVLTQRSTITWPVRPQGNLAGISPAEAAGFVEADLSDPIFQTLEVEIRCEAEFSAERVHSVTVRLAYGAQRHDAVFTEPGQTSVFRAIVDPALGRRYRYQPTVQFAATSKTLVLPEVEEDRQLLTVLVGEVGWLNLDLTAELIDWADVANVQVTVRYGDEAADVPTEEHVIVLDPATPRRAYERAIWAAVTNPVEYRVTYTLASGRTIERPWAEQLGPLLVVPDPYERTVAVRFAAPGGFATVATHVVEHQHDGPQGTPVAQTLVLDQVTPSRTVDWGLVAGADDLYRYRVSTTRRDGTSSVGDWVEHRGSGVVQVGELPVAELAVEVSAELVDWSVLRLVTVTLTAATGEEGHLIFDSSRPSRQTWRVLLPAGAAPSYEWTATSHNIYGTKNTSARITTTVPSLVLTSPAT
jgi:hypothetical protein